MGELLGAVIEGCVQLLLTAFMREAQEETDFRRRYAREEEDDARRELLWQRHRERANRRACGLGLADSTERSAVSAEARNLRPH